MVNYNFEKNLFSEIFLNAIQKKHAFVQVLNVYDKSFIFSTLKDFTVKKRI